MVSLSIDAVDSALMLWIVPTKSAFSTDWQTTVSLASMVGPEDNRPLRGSFNRYGRPRPCPELGLCFDSANGRLRGTAALR